jgi:hypothetical protein
MSNSYGVVPLRLFLGLLLRLLLLLLLLYRERLFGRSLTKFDRNELLDPLRPDVQTNRIAGLLRRDVIVEVFDTVEVLAVCLEDYVARLDAGLIGRGP